MKSNEHGGEVVKIALRDCSWRLRTLEFIGEVAILYCFLRIGQEIIEYLREGK